MAASDELKLLAQPMEFIPAESFDAVLVRLRRLIVEKDVELIVIGMPRNMDGSHGPAAVAVRDFVDRLRNQITVPLVTWDERLSTVQAHRLLRQAGHRAKQQKGKVDASAAAILLQSYLDSIQ